MIFINNLLKFDPNKKHEFVFYKKLFNWHQEQLKIFWLPSA